MQLLLRCVSTRSSVNCFALVSRHESSSLGRRVVLLPSLQESLHSNLVRNFSTSKDESNNNETTQDASAQDLTKKKKAISFRSGRPSSPSSSKSSNDVDDNIESNIGAQLSGRQFTLQGDYSKEAAKAKQASKPPRNIVERDLNFDSDFDIPSEDELANIRRRKSSNEIRLVSSSKRKSNDRSSNSRFSDDEDSSSQNADDYTTKRSNTQTFAKSSSRDNRQNNSASRGRNNGFDRQRGFEGEYSRNQRNPSSKSSRSRFDDDDDDGMNHRRRFDNNNNQRNNNNRTRNSSARDDNSFASRRDDYSRDNSDRRSSNRGGERNPYQSKSSSSTSNQRDKAQGLNSRSDDKRSAAKTSSFSNKSDYLRAMEDSGSGARREVVGLGSSFSAALQEEDDALDAEVRRSVSAHEQKKAKNRERKNQASSGDFKNTRGQQSQMSDDELYGPKIEISSEDCEFFYGKHPVAIALRWTDPKVLQRSSRLYVMEGSEAQDGPEMKLARSKGVQVEIASKMRMNEVMGQPPRPYQGLILELPKINYRTIKKDTVVAVDPSSASDANLLMLALDEINDPMNLGALLRSAHFFGLFTVLASEKNSASLSATVAKASAGAMFVLSTERRLLGTKNLVASLQAHKQGGWRVVGTSASAEGDRVVSLSELPSHPRTILVMGNEEQGLRTLVKAECDVLVHIPRPVRPPPTLPTIHSEKMTDFIPKEEDATEEDKIALNVSAAGAALLARLRL